MESVRSKTEIWGLGPMISDDDKVIAGRKLPTSRQVLRCFMAFYNEIEKAESRMHPPAMAAAADKALDCVEVHYKKADVPMMEPRKNCIRAIQNLYKNYVNNIRKISVDRRAKPFALKKVQEFNKELDKTMKLWPKNARAIISSISHPRELRQRNVEEDLKFFESMQSDRSATYGPADGLTRSLSKKRDERKRKLPN